MSVSISAGVECGAVGLEHQDWRGIMRVQSQQGFVPCCLLCLIIPVLINWPPLIEVLVKELLECGEDLSCGSISTWTLLKLPSILQQRDADDRFVVF